MHQPFCSACVHYMHVVHAWRPAGWEARAARRRVCTLHLYCTLLTLLSVLYLIGLSHSQGLPWPGHHRTGACAAYRGAAAGPPGLLVVLPQQVGWGVGDAG